MILITNIFNTLDNEYNIQHADDDFITFKSKTSDHKFTKSNDEMQFIINYINYNYKELSDDNKLIKLNKFFNLMQFYSNWDIESITNYLSKEIIDNPSALEQKNNLISFLFESNRAQPFHNTFLTLLTKKIEYQNRLIADTLSQIQEAAIGLVQSTTAYNKLQAANFLINKLLNFIFINNSKEDYLEFDIPPKFKGQFKSYDNLGKIFTDFQELGLLYNKINLSIDEVNNTQLSENFNKLCFKYLWYIKSQLSNDELYHITIDSSFNLAGSILSLLKSSYNSEYDYTKIYSRFISDINNSCIIEQENKEFDKKEKTSALNIITKSIYENPMPLASTKEWLIQNFPQGFKIHYLDLDKDPAYHKAIKSKDYDRKLLIDPKDAESSLMKSTASFGDGFDANAYTNLPGILSFDYQQEMQSGGFLRMGAQTYTSSGLVKAYPSFLRYLKVISEQLKSQNLLDINKNTSFLYICNLRTAGATKEVEANAEALRIKALIDASENNPELGLEVVVMPANRGFLNHTQREKDGCLDDVFHLHVIISQLTEIITNNGQDFYLSPRTKDKLFGDKSEAEIISEVQFWIQDSIKDLGLDFTKSKSQRCKINMSERQQLATHFFKYTLTNKLIEKLNPYRVATPCKDYIDRGMIHAVYFHIINLIISLDKKINNDEIEYQHISEEKRILDKKIEEILCSELHCGAILVKARRVNDHNIGLLVHTLDGFMKGRFFNLSDDFPLTQFWLKANSSREAIVKLENDKQRMEFIIEDKKNTACMLSFCLPKSTELSHVTKYLPTAIGTSAAATTAIKIAICSVGNEFLNMYNNFTRYNLQLSIPFDEDKNEEANEDEDEINIKPSKPFKSM
tara:strand:+ start:4669 stop:7233 length:2565 start_codon:yes stop_codon:yes gene_type:complete